MTKQRLNALGYTIQQTSDYSLLQDDVLQPSAVVWHMFRYLGFEKFFGNSAVCYKIFNQNTITLGVGTPAQITSPLPAPHRQHFLWRANNNKDPGKAISAGK